MARLYDDFIDGTTGADINSSDTALSSAGLVDLVAVSGANYVYITLDADGSAGAPEIVKITSHTAAASTATIVRAQLGTTARAHLAGTDWVAAAYQSDFERLDTLDTQVAALGATDTAIDTRLDLIEADDWVTQNRIGPSAVTSSELADFNVTADKIATDAVTSSKIIAAAVTGPKMATAVLSASSQATVTGGTYLTWATENSDPDACVSFSTNVVTVLKTGTYALAGKLTHSASLSSPASKMYLEKNGAATRYCEILFCATSGGGTFGGVHYFEASETFKLITTLSANGNTSAELHITRISG